MSRLSSRASRCLCSSNTCLKKSGFRKKPNHWCISVRACHSGGYLIHRYLLWVIEKECHMDYKSIVWRTAGALGIFVLSVLLTALLKKIPVLRKFVP